MRFGKKRARGVTRLEYFPQVGKERYGTFREIKELSWDRGERLRQTSHRNDHIMIMKK